MSSEAKAFVDNLKGEILAVPRKDKLLQYRLDTRASYEPTVKRALEKYDVQTEEININGTSCLQVTATDWSTNNGLCILYCYGGGMVAGSSYQDLIITTGLAHRLSARVISVDYRLAPEHSYPAAQQDVANVYPTLLDDYGASRLVVSGESAGGNLALALMVQMRDRNLELPRCAALFSPWVDLSSSGDSHQFNDNRDPTLNNAWVNLAVELYAPDQALDDPGVSPLYADLSGLPPTIISTGSRDLLLSDCLSLARNLRDSGVDCDLRVWEGLWHVFEFYDEIPETELSIREMANFIRIHSPS
jgi:monoterpene epsilon-lactone hydrolase